MRPLIRLMRLVWMRWAFHTLPFVLWLLPTLVTCQGQKKCNFSRMTMIFITSEGPTHRLLWVWRPAPLSAHWSGVSPGWRSGPAAWPSCLTCGWSWNRGFKGWLCLVAPADYIKSSMCSNSSCSLNSENPYATIRDPPALACKHTENSYVEMKSPSHREVPFGGTATLLGGAGRNVYDVGECVVALVCGAQQGLVAFAPAAHVPPGEHTRAWPWWEFIWVHQPT